MCRESEVQRQIEQLGTAYVLHDENAIPINKKPPLLTTVKRIEKNPTILTKWLKEQHATRGRGRSTSKVRSKAKED